MANDPFSPNEQMLINRLKDAPQPRLRPQAMEAIRAQLFLEMDVPLKPFWQTKAGLTSMAAVTTIIIIVIVLIGVSISGGDDESPTVDPISSPTMIETAPPTATSTASMVTSVTPQTSAAATAENTPSVATPSPQPTSTTSTSAGAPILVIEGPVSAITINTITVFDMTIQVDAGNPILTQLQIGDRVRIDGQTSVEGNIIIIVAVNITIIHTQIIVEPSGGGLPSNCKMTKNGKITCKDTRRTTRH